MTYAHGYGVGQADAITFTDADIARFWERVDASTVDACWPWLGALTGVGYGTVQYYKRRFGAHRLAYTLAVAPIPDGLLVCHRCDNPPCCNPSHLFLGTNRENTADMVRKGRARGKVEYGTERYNAKLTDDLVREVRARVRAGESRASVARDIGIDASTVGKVAAGKAWMHVAEVTP